MNGFTPITFEKFIHAVFGIKDKNKVTDIDMDQFSSDAKQTQTHYVFLMHSFELLYKECPKICDLIFQLYRINSEFMHIILSSDHINGGKMLNKFKFQLKMIFFHLPFGESFFYEKTHAVCIMDEAGDPNELANQTNRLFEGQLNLQSMKDVHQAVQPSCRLIMLYIMEHHVVQSELIARMTHEMEAVKSSRKSTSNRTLRSSVAPQEKKTEPTKAPKTADLDFSDLMRYCESRFIARRANLLRDHLGELKDHRLIEMDESGNKIQCQVPIETCKKFLDYIKSL